MNSYVINPKLKREAEKDDLRYFLKHIAIGGEKLKDFQIEFAVESESVEDRKA